MLQGKWTAGFGSERGIPKSLSIFINMGGGFGSVVEVVKACVGVDAYF